MSDQEFEALLEGSTLGSPAARHIRSLRTGVSEGHELLLWPLWTNFEQVWITQSGRCWDCDAPTHWADLDFMTFLHPGLCAKNKWREYQEAEELASRREAGLTW